MEDPRVAGRDAFDKFHEKQLTLILKSQKDIMQKIAVIGPGKNLCGTELYNFGVDLGKSIATPGRVIVCGGKGGFMEAVCKGAKLSPCTFEGQTIGILPEDTPEHANPFVDVSIPTGMGIARNIVIINTADIIIAAGGGSGTLSELAFAWQKGKTVLCLTQFGGWAAELAGKNIDDRNKDLLVKVQSIEEVTSLLPDNN